MNTEQSRGLIVAMSIRWLGCRNENEPDSHEIARRTSPDSCLSSTRPALIISNGNLPGLNGREFDAIFAEIAVIAGNSFAYHRYDVKSSFNFGLNPAMHTQSSFHDMAHPGAISSRHDEDDDVHRSTG